MEILKTPHPNLRIKCTEISDAKNTLLALEEVLILPTGLYKGVGLAANQIGLQDRVCIVRHPHQNINLVNPYIIKHGNQRKDSEEGCLSVGDNLYKIKRWVDITVKANNYPNLLYINDFEIARIIQHEVDHLNGLLLLDHIAVGRNDPCLCGSGLKHKKCCGRNI